MSFDSSKFEEGIADIMYDFLVFVVSTFEKFDFEQMF